MILVKRTEEFDKWLRRLRDYRAKAKILFRIQLIANKAHYGDFKSVGEGVFELRINYAKGYRVYYAQISSSVVLLLIGGNKSSQQRDVKRAQVIWNRLKNN